MQKILIFDPSDRNGDLYRREFEGEGYAVITAYNLWNTLKYYRTEHPALVLFIIESPGAGLLGTVEQMLSDNRRTPIVFTGSAPLHLEEQSSLAALKQHIRDLCPPPGLPGESFCSMPALPVIG